MKKVWFGSKAKAIYPIHNINKIDINKYYNLPGLNVFLFVPPLFQGSLEFNMFGIPYVSIYYPFFSFYKLLSRKYCLANFFAYKKLGA